MTFAATAEVVRYFKARPVVVDCEPDTLNLDPAMVERAVGSRTRAIIPVHFAGHPCEMAPILELAGSHQIRVIEDAAHALTARYRGRVAGTLGDIGCFSFYATKTLCTGEGGMVTTANPEYAERVRMMSLHGISKDAWKRYSGEGSWYYEILEPGFKYNMTDIAAALGLAQLRKVYRMRDARRHIAGLYDDGFRALSEIVTPTVRDRIDHAWHLYPIRLDLERLTIGRGEFIEMIRQRNIGASVHFIPLHLHPYYRANYDYRPQDFPNASNAYERLVSLPIYPGMTDKDAADVVSAVSDIVSHHHR